jgi:hypothetical protein
MPSGVLSLYPPSEMFCKHERGSAPTARLRSHLAATLLTVLLFGAGCRDAVSPDSVAGTPSGQFRTFTHNDSLAHGYLAPRRAQHSMVPTRAALNLSASEAMSVESVTPGYSISADQSQKITINLAGPVGTLSVIGNGAIECSGNYGQLIAYDANGNMLAASPLELIDPADCSPPWLPDNITHGAKGTVTVPVGIIAKVEITPFNPLYLPNGFSASQTYEVTLAEGTSAPCDSTGDPILDAPNIVPSLVNALKQSNPDATPGTGAKKEQAGAIFRRPDGTYFTFAAVDPNATECHVSLNTISPTPPASEPGAMLVAVYHTHPSGTNEKTYGCNPIEGKPQAQTLNDGLPVPRAAPNAQGGGSPGDWQAANQGFPHYTINKDGFLWRLDPNVPDQDRRKNPNKWNWKKAPPGCLKK